MIVFPVGFVGHGVTGTEWESGKGPPMVKPRPTEVHRTQDRVSSNYKVQVVAQMPVVVVGKPIHSENFTEQLWIADLCQANCEVDTAA